MAGLEQLEIHSKSYLMRWVRVEEGHTISWSIQPHKKSINFGIFKHPGTGGSGTVVSDDATTPLPQQEPGVDKSGRPSNPRKDSSTAQEQLKAKGFIAIQWYGKCEADKVSMGVYAVPAGGSGNYGLVFDNTFSKQLSKTATFVLLTYPSNAPPHSTHHQVNVPASMTAIGLGKSQSPRISATASDSVDSLHSHLGTSANSRSRGNSVQGRHEGDENATYHVGVLSKRRRKRGQGYARRFFSLDFVSCTLSYYHNRNSSALRGAMPLSLAAITADGGRREINIDTGAEIWHLKAGSAKDFDDWTKALEKASRTARGVQDESTIDPELHKAKNKDSQPPVTHQEDSREWEQVEGLVSRIVGTRDAVRRLSKDTAPNSSKRAALAGLGLSSGSPQGEDAVDYFAISNTERKPFWRRKSSAPTTPQMLGRGISSQLAVPSPATSMVNNISANGSMSRSSQRGKRSEDSSIHDHCSALLNDLDSVLADFATLIANVKRRQGNLSNNSPRNSLDSIATGEFFDAEAGEADRSQVHMIDRASEEDTQPSEVEDGFGSDASSISSAEGDDDTPQLNGTTALFPVKPKSLTPLPISTPVKRRQVVPQATVLPPSLIGFLRKNVGKDLSTISMPVSANEPTSLLQRVAEQLEYAQLLDAAAALSDPTQRLLHVAALAVSGFSNGRARERAIRKPFNPMLGETFELIRTEDETPGGFRFLAEKVSHRPVRMACQADSAHWSFSQSPAPTQKFWGKSAEIITEGRVRVVLRLANGTDELYSWNVASAFLRNVVMGEKYVEPVGSMTVTNESTGAKAVIEFKVKGMFGGRSEDVQVDAYGPDGAPTSYGLVGTWTQSLRVQEAGKAHGAEIWRVGTLVDNAAQRYGLTSFAATLNEITALEEGKLPRTDCRLRPDQRAAESGQLDEAETVKARLEEGQRARRRELEEAGRAYKPRWFVRVEGEGGDGGNGEEVWRLKGGKEGYWEERAKGVWTGVEDVLMVA